MSYHLFFILLFSLLFSIQSMSDCIVSGSDCYGLSYFLAPLTDWIFAAFTVLLLIEWYLFRQILESTPLDLNSLAQSGRLVPLDSTQTINFDAEICERIHCTFGHFTLRRGGKQRGIPIWLVASVIVMLPMLYYLYLSNVHFGWLGDLQKTYNGMQAGEDARLIARHFFAALQGGIIPFFWAIPVGAGMWILFRIGTGVGKLIEIFHLDPIPGHPDSCGGLRKLGDIYFRIALLGFVAQLATFGIALRGLSADVASPVILTSGLIALVFTVLAVFSFIIPVWRIHKAMQLARDMYEQNLTERISEVEKQLRMYLSTSDDNELEIKIIQEKIEALRKLSPAERGFPTWPFSRRITWIIGPNIVIPLATIAVSLLPTEIQGILRTLLGLG